VEFFGPGEGSVGQHPHFFRPLVPGGRWLPPLLQLATFDEVPGRHKIETRLRYKRDLMISSFDISKVADKHDSTPIKILTLMLVDKI